MSFVNASCTVSKLITFQPFPVSIRRLFFLRVSNPSYFKPELIYGELIPAWAYLLLCRLASVPGSSSHARPSYLWLCLQSVDSTAFRSGSAVFPCVIPHPPVPVVPSVSCTWSVTCCPSLCLVDPAQQHPRAAGCTGDRNKHQQWSWWDRRAEKALEAFLLQEQW